jgi:hypothetical protein
MAGFSNFAGSAGKWALELAAIAGALFVIWFVLDWIKKCVRNK